MFGETENIIREEVNLLSCTKTQRLTRSEGNQLPLQLKTAECLTIQANIIRGKHVFLPFCNTMVVLCSR